MAEITLQFLAERVDRVLDEIAQVRDDIRVMAAMIRRLDGTVNGLTQTVQELTNEVRAEHSRFDRPDRRLRKIEEESAT